MIMGSVLVGGSMRVQWGVAGFLERPLLTCIRCFFFFFF